VVVPAVPGPMTVVLPPVPDGTAEPALPGVGLLPAPPAPDRASPTMPVHPTPSAAVAKKTIDQDFLFMTLTSTAGCLVARRRCERGLL
jgi:hypothetical protein